MTNVHHVTFCMMNQLFSALPTVLTCAILPHYWKVKFQIRVDGMSTYVSQSKVMTKLWPFEIEYPARISGDVEFFKILPYRQVKF